MTGESLWRTVFSGLCTKVWMEELVCFPVLKISSARETILNHRWELFSPHNERKWLEEAIQFQGGRFHWLHLRSLILNLCLIKQAQSWKIMLMANKSEVERLWLNCVWSDGLPGAQGHFEGIWRRNLKITPFNATAKSCLAMLTQQNRDCKPRHSFLSAAVTTA